MVKNLLSGDMWIPGVVVQQSGPLTFLVDVGEGRVWKRHIDHLKLRELLDAVSGVQEDTTGTENFLSPVADLEQATEPAALVGTLEPVSPSSAPSPEAP